MKRILWGFVFVFGTVLPLLAQQSPLAKQPIPFDPAVRKGTLPNGLTYYIRKNTEPQNRAELRLAVKAGSLLETPEQLGLAHFMEHMNFNGTKNFPKNELVNFLQKTGVRFGADLNAYTSFDETVYMLPIPTDSAGLLERGLQVLEDWAHNALLDASEIEKERGVVLEESRMGRGAQQRMRDRYLPMILNNSRYAERLPIGQDSIIQHFKPETLRAFYTDWYRPDLMSVIAVGDFEVDQVEAMIKEKFGRIRMPRNPKKRPEYTIPLNGSTQVAIVTDAEYPQNLIQLVHKKPEIKEKTLLDLRSAIVRNLFNSMMADRMQELTQRADPPFLFGVSNYGGFVSNLDAYTSIALAQSPEGIERALVTLLEENNRLKKFGFTEAELDRAKKSFLNQIEKAYKERDKSKSASYVQQYLNHFLKGNAVMDVSAYYAFVNQHLEGIKLEEVNRLAPVFVTDKDRAVVIMAPEKAKEQLPTEARIRELLATAGQNVTAYVDDVLDAPLLAKQPMPSKVKTEVKRPELGVTDWTLGNGVRVLLKPTDFKNDQILFEASGKGGTSLFPDELETGIFASYLVGSGGVGPYSQVQLQKFLAGKSANVGAYINELAEGVSGSTSPKDFELALQLIHAYFVSPRKDAEVAAGILANQKAYLENMMQTLTPEKVYSDTLSAVLSNYHPRRAPLTPQRVDKVNLDRALAIYRDRFADASDFVFTFVGAFDPEQIKPLIETYLGGLPSTDRNDTYRHPAIFPPSGRIEKVVYKGTEPKARVTMVYSGQYSYTPENNMQLEALEKALQIKLIEALREEESGVYGVGVSSRTDKHPSGHYQLSIGFGCGPENVDKLVARTLSEIEKLRANGADAEDIQKFKSESRRKNEVALKTNEFWLSYLDSSVFSDNDLLEVLREDALLDTVTVSSTKQAASGYFNEANFIKIVLLPEKK